MRFMDVEDDASAVRWRVKSESAKKSKVSRC